MRQSQRVDLQVGRVPDYRTFVRHLWSYSDPDGFSISEPPVVYRVVFDDEDHAPVRAVAKQMATELEFGNRVEWREAPEFADSSNISCWELRFLDLKALHTFCVLLGDRARMESDDVAIRVGEFIMWTLGFRWV
jgi:hypothetical protein